MVLFESQYLFLFDGNNNTWHDIKIPLKEGAAMQLLSEGNENGRTGVKFTSGRFGIFDASKNIWEEQEGKTSFFSVICVTRGESAHALTKHYKIIIDGTLEQKASI
jgi:hypothetical protein